MKQGLQENGISFSNVLYIGDEPKVCISVIEKFNNMLQEIENTYRGWFVSRDVKNKFYNHDKLQYHIHYHFEGGVAMFKFKDDELPSYIRNECLNACNSLK